MRPQILHFPIQTKTTAAVSREIHTRVNSKSSARLAQVVWKLSWIQHGMDKTGSLMWKPHWSLQLLGLWGRCMTNLDVGILNEHGQNDAMLLNIKHALGNPRLWEWVI